jgi:carbamoyltransferase
VSKNSKRTGVDSLCFAGGVALNVAANSRIVRESGFKRVFIQAAAGDDGQAIGRLLFRMHDQFKLPRQQMKNAYLGPTYDEEEIKSALNSEKERLEFAEHSQSDLLDETVSRLASGKVVAWFQGSSELGPRALGHRSILADPRNQNMQERLNCHVKHREWFRPFGLSVLEQKVNQYFSIEAESPFMLMAVTALPAGHNAMPSGIHVDGSSRLQTLTSQQNDLFFDLVTRFDQVTGVPALINTSFNDKKQPIVETPQDAVETFLAMGGIDALAIGSYIAQRAKSHK